MKLYTKTGDDGSTGLFGGARASKAAPRIEAYGTVDELNSALGLARAATDDAPLGDVLAHLQAELFVLGADLATPRSTRAKPVIDRLEAAAVERLEGLIDTHELELPPLKSFILPGGDAAGAWLHMARTICRRAERLVVALSAHEELGEVVLPYLNRLSDLLFVLARVANHRAGVDELPWSPERKRG